MGHTHAFDLAVRERLRQWPQVPPGLPPRSFGRDNWLRARPGAGNELLRAPFLKFPGSDRWRTLPDGLWLNFGGVPGEGFVDILAIEACSSAPNMLDKRSRFAPSVQSMLVVCPLGWLLEPVDLDDPTARWRRTDLFDRPPTGPACLPVRDVRVVYALLTDNYLGFVTTQIPHPHEYFVPMARIMAEDSQHDPELRALFGRAGARANFLSIPEITLAEYRQQLRQLPPGLRLDGP